MSEASRRPCASVLIPTRDPGLRITSVLKAIFAQETNFTYEVLVIDSGSGPADLERIRGFPVQLECIPSSSFGHGRTRNLLAQRARGEALLFLSQDAEPASSGWMETLVSTLSESSVAGAYARQIPRPEADPLVRFFLNEMYSTRPSRRRVQPGGRLTIDDMFFSNVSSALRKEVWQQVPFREHVAMSEDQYWAHDALRAGYELVYEPTAQVYHSHNYSLAVLFRRNRLSGRSLRGLIADSPAAVIRRGATYVAREAQYLMSGQQTHRVPYMLVYELVKSVGFALGSLEGGGRVSMKYPPPGAVQRFLS